MCVCGGGAVTIVILYLSQEYSHGEGGRLYQMFVLGVCHFIRHFSSLCIYLLHDVQSRVEWCLGLSLLLITGVWKRRK